MSQNDVLIFFKRSYQFLLMLVILSLAQEVALF
jgi:hypothetical protein